MSYHKALGYTVMVDLPIMGQKPVTFDLEKVSSDAADAAFNRIRYRLKNDLPAVLKESTPAFKTTLMPPLLEQTVQTLDPAAQTFVDRNWWKVAFAVAVPVGLATIYLRRVLIQMHRR
jgi:hypothetical protein